jgi:hypothetical protein
MVLVPFYSTKSPEQGFSNHQSLFSNKCFMGDSSMDSRGRNQLDDISRYSFRPYGGRYYIPNPYSKPGMSSKIFLLIANLIGFPVTAWVMLLNIASWKENVLWGLIAAFWLFKLIRACIKAYQEYQEKQIELKEKRKRYDKDIFS